MLTVVTFLWGTAKYRAEHVNALRAAVARGYQRPHRFVCVTNQPEGIECETIPDREDFAAVWSPHGRAAPSCYRRLRLFGPDAARDFGGRIAALDLDATVHGDLAPLWDRPEAFVGWRDPFYGHRGQFCGSMFLLTAGAHLEVWTEFDPIRSPVLARAAGFRGSDQAWISYKLLGAPAWTRADGVYSYRCDVEGRALPADARIVLWHGRVKPWDRRRL